MSENRKDQFYEIIKKEDMFEVLKENSVVFTLQCEELIQCDTALAAKQANGLYSIYLPVLVVANQWDFKEGLIYVLENVKEFYYHNKPNHKFNNGLLLLKVETGDSCGYWTAIDIEFFEWHLTPERAKTRRNSLFQIPYTGVSEATFMEEFDYLPLDKYLIKIDNAIHLIDNLSGSVYSHSARMLVKTLGEVQVEPLPFEWYFKVISKEGVSFFTTAGCCNEGCKQFFGPFFNIEKVEFEDNGFAQEYPIFYLAKNENNEILGMFFEKLYEDHRKLGPSVYKNVFDSPIKDAKLIQIIKTSNGTIASWKLSYDSEKSKILLCSISNENSISIILDVSDYI